MSIIAPNTFAQTTDNGTKVVLYDTAIIQFNDNVLNFNTGGFNTNTTVDRLNKVSDIFGLGYKAKVRKKTLTVEYNGQTYTAVDNRLVINR
jgi:hypothetical protein